MLLEALKLVVKLETLSEVKLETLPAKLTSPAAIARRSVVWGCAGLAMIAELFSKIVRPALYASARVGAAAVKFISVREDDDILVPPDSISVMVVATLCTAICAISRVSLMPLAAASGLSGICVTGKLTFIVPPAPPPVPAVPVPSGFCLPS